MISDNNCSKLTPVEADDENQANDQPNNFPLLKEL
jgi:hypothetical protein